MASKGFWMSPKTRTLIPVSWKTVSAMCQMYRRTDRNTNMCNIVLVLASIAYYFCHNDDSNAY